MLQKFNRLRGMTTDEIHHRLREHVRVEVGRIRTLLPPAPDSELANLVRKHGSLKSYLQHGPARRFYPSTQDREGTAGFIARQFPEWIDQAARQAADITQHRLHLLGHRDIVLGRDMDWHRDPVSGFEWPRRYWADYNLVESPPADVKVIHELNRHQHLPRLARAYFLTGDEAYAREALSQIESWIAQNPPRSGINWQSSLEIAFRVTSWMWTLFLVLPSRALGEDLARSICGSLFQQLDHIHRYPSTYTSPNTHLIGEAAALYTAGLLFPELPRAEQWRQFGSITLLNEMQRQVSSEGVHMEMSSYYHCYAADFYLHALALARWNRAAFPDWMWTRLSAMLEFVLHLTRPDGSMPLLGDDDGGRVLPLAAEDYRSYRDGLCSGAVLFGRGDFKHVAGTFCEESLWLLGDDAWSIFNSVPARAPAALRRSYAGAGYLIQRSGWDEGATHMVFDCGGFGMSSGGHAHADALSFSLFTGGHEFLIDPGTSVYNRAPEWRKFFRSTQAHNTVVVDGASQSDPKGTFSWNRKAGTRNLMEIARPGIEYIDGEHDGYLKLSNEITHRRRLLYIRPNYWIVLDDVRGRGDHDYEFLYHFAREAELAVLGDERQGEIDCRARIQDAALQMFLYASGPLHAAAVCGERGPIQGWSSRRYGEMKPSPVLRAKMHGAAPAGMVSLLMPGTHSVATRRFLTNSGKVIAVAVRDGEYDDVVVMSMEDAVVKLIDCSMRGELFWMRMKNGSLVQLLAVNARAFSCAGETVFDNAEAIPYVQTHFWENGMVIERGEDEGKVYVRDMRDRQFQRN